MYRGVKNMRKRSGKLLAFLLALTMTAGMMAGCGSDKAEGSADTEQTQETQTSGGKKTFVFGDNTFNA